MKDEMTNVLLDDIPEGSTEKSKDSFTESQRQHRRHHHHRSSSHSHKHKHRYSKHKKRTSAISEKRKRKIKDFFHNNKKRLTNIVIALLFLVALIVVASFGDIVSFNDNRGDDNSGDVNANQTISTLQFEIPVFTDEVSLVSQAVLDYLDEENTLTASQIHNKYSSEGRLDVGLPVRLYYNILGVPSGYSVSSSKLEVSEYEDFSSPRIFTLPSNKRSVDVYNLKTATQYYYRFEVKLTDSNIYTVSGSFKTANTPRMLNIEGVYNARDIGGLKTIDGRTIKQGLLYRGTELDGAVYPKFTITSNGLTDMLTVLGIKTDIDLRSPADSDGFDALGGNVEHVCYNSHMYKDIFSDSGKRAIKNIFSDLAKRENYPVYMHCTYGMDRTGTVCYLLEALLGVDEISCMNDYEYSILHYGKVDNTLIDEFVVKLKSQGGSNLKSNAENYLLSTGVTAEEIMSIRDIFLSEN